MKTLLKLTSLLLVVAIPTAFSAESYGIALPTLIDTAHLFGAFVASVTLLTMITDYGRSSFVGSTRRSLCAVPASKAALRLAA